VVAYNYNPSYSEDRNREASHEGGGGIRKISSQLISIPWWHAFDPSSFRGLCRRITVLGEPLFEK
jgi:hypothetical protein